MESLQPYRLDDILISSELQQLKVNEAILILIQTQPDIMAMLMDFSDPANVNLESFMEKKFISILSLTLCISDGS